MAGSTRTKETEKGMWATPATAHQVAKVDVVQILQPSTMDAVPALLTVEPHGNVRPKAGPCSHASYRFP